jgi:dethiobiotin synthetase
MTRPTGPSPMCTVAITGTATEVGKTWFTARLIEQLRASGHLVAVRKPVQSFEPTGRADTDADLLAEASGEDVHAVCPPHRWYEIPMAPPMAADRLGLDRIESSTLINELNWPADVEFGFVETVGGVRSPLSHDTDSAGFANCVGASHAILVADAGLGTINAVRLSMGPLGPITTLVFLNHFDGSDLHARNLDWLTRHDGFTVVTSVEAAGLWLVDMLATSRSDSAGTL